MFQFDSDTLDLIRKSCRGKKHIKLSCGFMINGEKTVKVFDEHGETDNENYIYEIGSIGKTFTASLLSKYVHEGRMSLDDSIQKYFESLDSGRYYPTLRRLATHTAGYPARYPLSQREYLKLFLDMIIGVNKGEVPFRLDLAGMRALIQKTKLENRDYKWEYANFGFALLGYATGVVHGKGFSSAMDEFLSKELGLCDSYVGAYRDRNLHGYTRRNKDCGKWKWDNVMLMAPAGAISSTADDLLAWAGINMNEEKPYLPLCHKKHANISKKHDIGLGWWLQKKNNNVIMHGGGTGSFSTHLMIDKSKKLASIVLGNYQLGYDTDEKIDEAIMESLQRETS